MAKIEIETMVVVRRTVITIDEHSRRRGGLSRSRMLKTRTTAQRLMVTASSLLALAGVALGEVARHRWGGTALPWPPVAKALPASVGRSVRSLPAGPRVPASHTTAAALPDERD